MRSPWYESILEVPAESHWPPDDPILCHFQTGPTQLALSVLEPVPAAGRCNFSVADVDYWWQKLRDRAEVVEPLFDTPYAAGSSPSRIRTGTSSDSSARSDPRS